MISFLVPVASALVVLALYTAIGRLAVPPGERLPLRELGWAGRVHTLRRSLVVLADCAPRGGARRR